MGRQNAGRRRTRCLTELVILSDRRISAMGRPERAHHEARRRPCRSVAGACHGEPIGGGRRPDEHLPAAIAYRRDRGRGRGVAKAHVPEATGVRAVLADVRRNDRPYAVTRFGSRPLRPSGRQERHDHVGRATGRWLGRPSGVGQTGVAHRARPAEQPRVEPLIEPISPRRWRLRTRLTGKLDDRLDVADLHRVDARNRPRDPFGHRRRADHDRDSERTPGR